MITRIQVVFTGLPLDARDRGKVERVLRLHADARPVARSVRGSIEVTTTLG